MSARERVVITGLGAVCGSGMDPEAILAAVRARTSAIGPIQNFDTTGWPVTQAGEGTAGVHASPWGGGGDPRVCRGSRTPIVTVAAPGVHRGVTGRVT